MGMDMIEDEVNDHSIGALAARSDSTLMSIGAGGVTELNRTFLVKRMEINFMHAAAVATDDAAWPGTYMGMLCFQKTSGGSDFDTSAEMFDAVLENKAGHELMIWSRYLIGTPSLLDDADQISLMGLHTAWKTSKSFPKGYPLDKHDTYAWRFFNPSASVAIPTGSLTFLNVRYWGVFL